MNVNKSLNSKITDIPDGQQVIVDFDTTVTSGFYNYDSSSLNRPTTGGTSGNVLVIHGYKFIHQVVFVGNESIYMRRYSFQYEAWNDWYVVSLKSIS